MTIHKARYPTLEDGSIPWDDSEMYVRKYDGGLWTRVPKDVAWHDPEPFTETLTYRKAVSRRGNVSIIAERGSHGGTVRMAWKQFEPLIPHLLYGEIFGTWQPYKSGDKYLVKLVGMPYE